jgi:hypothetical protein
MHSPNIRSTKDALREVNEEMAASDNCSFSDKLADWGNKWFGLIENMETFSEVLGSVRETLHEVVILLSSLLPITGSKQ